MRYLASNLFICLFIFGQSAYSQYLEDFPSDNKGIIAGPCGATAPTCAVIDFTGVNWDINGDLSGIDTEGLFTTGGVLIYSDVDVEVCWESPVLDISGAGGTVSLAVDLTYTDFDTGDYINVDYNVDVGGWMQVSNAIGGGAGTVHFNFGSNHSGSISISQPGISGSSTLSVRVCGDTNLPSEPFTADNVSVPEAGVAVLPVEWASFNVAPSDDGNVIQWTTYSEVNNDRFVIEKSLRGDSEFYTIGQIEGAGNTASSNDYSFIDDEITNGLAYYRIKQIDYDGKHEYSRLLSVNTVMDSEYRLSPNPFTNHLNITSSQNSKTNQHLDIYDAFGQKVLTQIINQKSKEIDVSTLPSGIYYIKVGHSGLCQKLVKI